MHEMCTEIASYHFIVNKSCAESANYDLPWTIEPVFYVHYIERSILMSQNLVMSHITYCINFSLGQLSPLHNQRFVYTKALFTHLARYFVRPKSPPKSFGIGEQNPDITEFRCKWICHLFSQKFSPEIYSLTK